MVSLVFVTVAALAAFQPALAYPQVKPALGFIPGAGAPAYLQVEGHRDCLGELQPEGAVHLELCLPDAKPEECADAAWQKLGDLFEGQSCEVEGRQAPGFVGGVGAPEYLQVEGNQDCLGKFQPEGAGHTEKCIPQTQLEGCLDAAWEELNKVFHGETCPEGFQRANLEVDAREEFNFESILDEAKDNLPLITCSGDADCPEDMSHCFAANRKSVCIPKDITCQSDYECRTVGNNAVGSLQATCQGNQCVYSEFFILA